MPKRLSALLNNCNITLTAGNPDILIEGIAYDSRYVKTGYAFFALTGIHTDGHNFIEDAIERGACAVFVSRMPEKIKDSVSWILVDDTRKAMAFFSSEWYGNPAENIKIIGVTGTDGKSTTVSFIYQLLNLLGKKSGFISTVEYDCSGKPEKNPYRQSTPESPEIMHIISEMVRNNFEYGVIESTSHGLSEKTSRLAAIQYDAAVLTNVTHEHLEFHGTMEKYINDKANLFRKTTGFCVVNYSEPSKMSFINAAASPVVSYSLEDNKSDIYASSIISDSSGSSFDANYKGKSFRCLLPVPGIFNIENFLAASLAVSGITGEDMGKVLSLSGDLVSVKGRMDIINSGQDFTLIVDYAHTPGAFEKIFPMIKKTVKGRLIALFGSAGERDTEKRAIQGKIASLYSDILILTDEDPRGEDSMDIIRQISSGIKPSFDKSSLYLIPDRQEAISKAVEIAEQGDTVILLGKGHESTIIYNTGPVPWNEREAALTALKNAGYGRNI